MSYFSCFPKNNQIPLLSFVFFVSTFFIQISKVKCFPSNLTETYNYNNTMFKYQQAIINYNGFSKKMDKITLNFYLKMNFKELTKFYEELKSEILKCKTKQEKNEINQDDIIKVEKSLKYFEIKYKKTYKTYQRFEGVKNLLLHMLKVFIIVLSIIIVVALILIGIGTYFVLKRQKYYELQEEISVRIDHNENGDKETNLEENVKKNNYMSKSTESDLPPNKDIGNTYQISVEPNNAVSKEFLGKNKKV